MEENNEMTVKESNYSVMNLDEVGGNSNTKTEVFTNITDEKVLFNLEDKVDNMINDCVGECIRVKDMIIKRYSKPLKEPIINEETGEILKDKEYSMSCVLVDDNGVSYATGSKTFIIRLMRYLRTKADKGDITGTFDIKITKKSVGEQGNKALSFELI